MTVKIQNNNDDNTLVQSVIDIQKQENNVMNKGSTDRKLRNKMRRVCEDND